MQQKVDQLQTSLDTSEASLTQQLGQVKIDLETSFQSALQAQQHSIANGFQDLTAMFQQTQETKGVRRSHQQMEDSMYVTRIPEVFNSLPVELPFCVLPVCIVFAFWTPKWQRDNQLPPSGVDTDFQRHLENLQMPKLCDKFD